MLIGRDGFYVMECPQYYVMRYEALVSPPDVEEVWSKESQVGSKLLIDNQVQLYGEQPEHYRNIQVTICREERIDDN